MFHLIIYFSPISTIRLNGTIGYIGIISTNSPIGMIGYKRLIGLIRMIGTIFCFIKI